MTVTKWSLLAALAAVVSTSGGIFWHRRDRWHEAVWLRQENTRLQQEIQTRVHALDSAARQSRTQATSALETTPVAAPAETSNRPASPVPKPDYRNEGNATPQATLQTFAWACDQGDVATVARLIQFDEAARERALAFMAALPEEARQRWATPEAMAATLLVNAGMQSPFPHAAVLDTVEVDKISADRVKLRLSGIRRADSEYQLMPDGWKYVITAERVETYLAQQKRR